jgi:DNA ligase D-like protein (predicted 3'-phosphoesterase)
MAPKKKAPPPESQTTLFPDEKPPSDDLRRAESATGNEGDGKDEGGGAIGDANKKGGDGKDGEREYELSSDFAERFWKIEVDNEAMKNCYLVHEHNSRRLHWDLRLEKDGLLKSWAVPKEPPAVEGVRRLAVKVEDHPLGYVTFEGEIPAGNYGAGTVKIWDRGKYEPVELRDDKWVFMLEGEKLRGRYCLIRLKPRPGEKGENWLFFKAKS